MKVIFSSPFGPLQAYKIISTQKIMYKETRNYPTFQGEVLPGILVCVSATVPFSLQHQRYLLNMTSIFCSLRNQQLFHNLSFKELTLIPFYDELSTQRQCCGGSSKILLKTNKK